MITNEYTLNLDIKKSMANVLPIFAKGETGTIRFRIFDDGILYNLSGYVSSQILFYLPNAQTYLGTATYENGFIVYNLSGLENGIIGEVTGILTVSSNGGTISTQPFKIEVYDNLRDEEITSITLLQNLIAEVTATTANAGNEIQRQANEQERILAETQRQTNEMTRESNERDREIKFDENISRLRAELLIPKKHNFGNQLRNLKEALGNPLFQQLNIVFLGDSITWGRTLPNNATFDPRDGTLSDPRDNFASASFVNEIKRYIGRKYSNNSNPILSNWPASPSGQSTVEYNQEYILYPFGGDFTLTSTGTSNAISETATAASITGFQTVLGDGNVNGTSSQSIKFNFTGSEFTLSFGCLEADATYYNLYINDSLIGTYSTHAGVDGFVNNTSDNRRTHTFPFVKNATIEIRTNRNGENTGNRRLRVQGIIINKKIRIINQGINGATSRSHNYYNLSNNTFGDGEAVNSMDSFVFIQLGTNDRLASTVYAKGSNTFKRNLKETIDKISPLSDIILMAANPVIENPIYSFTQREATDVIYRLAKENNIDMIDNYSIFEGQTRSVFTVDGIHPNADGHNLIYRHIVSCLESD